MTLKVADFGYANQQAPGVPESQLKSYRGTFTYMAPEIKEEKKAEINKNLHGYWRKDIGLINSQTGFEISRVKNIAVKKPINEIIMTINFCFSFWDVSFDILILTL